MTTLTVVPQVSDLDLRQLLSEVGRGSGAAFAEVYDRFAPVVHGISSALLSDPLEAIRATEEALLDVWRSAPGYLVEKDPDRWLAMMAVRSVGRRLGEVAGTRRIEPAGA